MPRPRDTDLDSESERSEDSRSEGSLRDFIVDDDDDDDEDDEGDEEIEIGDDIGSETIERLEKLVDRDFVKNDTDEESDSSCDSSDSDDSDSTVENDDDDDAVAEGVAISSSIGATHAVGRYALRSRANIKRPQDPYLSRFYPEMLPTEGDGAHTPSDASTSDSESDTSYEAASTPSSTPDSPLSQAKPRTPTVVSTDTITIDMVDKAVKASIAAVTADEEQPPKRTRTEE